MIDPNNFYNESSNFLCLDVFSSEAASRLNSATF